MAEWKRWLWGPNPWVGSIEATTSRHIALTFDDGPDPVQTPLMLKALEDHAATATFFVLLTRARRHPDVIQAVLEAGHELGLHGSDHTDLRTLSHRAVLVRTRQARQELEEITGRPVRWFRPPYGRQVPSSMLAVHRAGLTTVLWSATACDWRPASDEERWKIALRGARPGAIVLAHDGIAGPEDRAEEAPPPLADRASWMDQLLHEFASRGLEGRSLSGALETGRAVKTGRMTLPWRSPVPAAV